MFRSTAILTTRYTNGSQEQLGVVLSSLSSVEQASYTLPSKENNTRYIFGVSLRRYPCPTDRILIFWWAVCSCRSLSIVQPSLLTCSAFTVLPHRSVTIPYSLRTYWHCFYLNTLLRTVSDEIHFSHLFGVFANSHLFFGDRGWVRTHDLVIRWSGALHATLLWKGDSFVRYRYLWEPFFS